MTNAIEVVAVNIQIQENFSIRKAFKGKNGLMLFKGTTWRCLYFGFFSTLFFLTFQQFAMHLNVDIALFED